MEPSTTTVGAQGSAGRRSLLVVACALLCSVPIACTRPPPSAKIFEDVTLTSGLPSYAGMTYGAFWGDFDGDGRPDLYVTNHLNGAKLFRNLGNGKFADVTSQWFAPADVGGDKHGAAWADFNNDGRLDLVQMMGAEGGLGSEPKRLFINRGDHFENIGDAAGIANPFGRTRMPLVFDANRDGKLDLFEGAEARFDDRSPPFFFIQGDGKFDASDNVANLVSRSAPFCVVTELGKDGPPDLICRVYGKDKAAQVFSSARLPMPELDLLPRTAFEDIAAADFNNDGFIDLYMARKNQAPPVSFGRPSANELIADVLIDQHNGGKPLGFSFRSSGQLSVRVVPAIPPDALSPDKIHIGASATHPNDLAFALSPETAGVAGMASFEPGGQAGVYIGLTAPDKWQVLVSAARTTKSQQVQVKITSPGEITALEVVGDPQIAEEAPGRLFINRAGKLVDEGEKWGINARSVSAVNVVAGDFNNDMYDDLFVVVSGDTGKQENLLLLNRGDGHFDVIPGAGGAAGDRVGVGDSVTTVDYDGDGFLDLLVTTGGSMGRSFGLPSDDGGYRLYHNVGNSNRWLEIDLEGTKSNRDGIGSRVELTAGGVTQTRFQDGGIHNHGQNHSRLHFGLAGNKQADKITIRWPSGTTQELTNVQSNQVLRIKEP